MKTAICQLKSLSPYNQSRQHFTDKEEKETHESYERRTWKEKGHYDENGEAFIPPMAFKSSISAAAAMLDMKIPGKGNSKYNKHFVAGIMVTDPVPLGINKEDVQPQWISCDPQGRKGGMGVMRAFPHYDHWNGTIRVYVLDDTIPKDIFEKVIREAGNFVGIGQFRPQKGGYFGRFEVESIKWE
jgi:hypothetical protein